MLLVIPRPYPDIRRVFQEGETPRMFKGYCFHIPSSSGEKAVKVAINARFSLIAVACVK